jgi:hypothetical protein
MTKGAPATARPFFMASRALHNEVAPNAPINPALNPGVVPLVAIRRHRPVTVGPLWVVASGKSRTGGTVTHVSWSAVLQVQVLQGGLENLQSGGLTKESENSPGVPSTLACSRARADCVCR